MKKKILIGVISIIAFVLLFYIIQSVYLTIRITKLRIDKYNDVPYVQNDFISQDLYNNLATSVSEHGAKEKREKLKEIETDYYVIGFTYTFVSFNKAHYSGNYSQKFVGISADGNKIGFGSVASTYVDLVFEDFGWKVVEVWEDP
jgi:hypothetical protein